MAKLLRQEQYAVNIYLGILEQIIFKLSGQYILAKKIG